MKYYMPVGNGRKDAKRPEMRNVYEWIRQAH